MYIPPKTLRYAEPIGQILVLVAFGAQFFWLEPKISEFNKEYLNAQLQIVRSLSAQITFPTDREVIEIEKRVQADEDRYLALSQENMALRKSWVRPLFAALFIVGSLCVATGKWASIRT